MLCVDTNKKSVDFILTVHAFLSISLSEFRQLSFRLKIIT
jgi:hypothetical protein